MHGKADGGVIASVVLVCSLGGLYSRYCVGLLYERGFVDRVQPVNYISLSSPHMGSRRCYFGARMSSVFQWAAPKVLARTGT